MITYMVIALCLTGPRYVLGQAQKNATNDNPPGFRNSCCKIINHSNVPVVITRFTNEDGDGRRAYLNKGEEWLGCGYNDDYGRDVGVRVKRYMPGMGWATVQAIKCHNPSKDWPFIQVINYCETAAGKGDDQCVRFYGDMWNPRQSTQHFSENESKDININGDNASRGRGTRFGDSRTSKHLQYEIYEVPALCYKQEWECARDWRRDFTNSRN